MVGSPRKITQTVADDATAAEKRLIISDSQIPGFRLVVTSAFVVEPT